MSDSKNRILVVGTGSIGERHVRCYLATGRADVSICEAHSERRKAVAEAYAIESKFDDISEALKQSWDAVLIATPAHTHIPIATLAVEAGNNVLLEKPLSTSLNGIAELQQLIAEKDVVAAVSYQLRAHPATNGMKEALDSGRFGKPLQLYMTSGQSFPFYRPAYRETYFADRRTGGGAIQDAITHMLNLAEWLVGPMTRISVDAQHQHLDGVTVEDTVHILARHGSVMASYAMNMYQQPNDGQLTVVCEKGTVRYESNNQRWRCMTEPSGEWETFTHEFTDRDGWYITNASLLLDVVERKRPPLCSLEDALQTLKVNLAALKSAETQTWQDII